MLTLMISNSHLEDSHNTTATSEPSLSGGNVVYGSHNQIYQDLSVVATITKAKFPVYLVNSRITKKNYAMKVFPFDGEQPHLYYKNESRFACLQHPHVIRNLYSESERKAACDGKEKKISYTIMEFAEHGDFYNFLRRNKEIFDDDKIIRTYFRQLIQGLEYIHDNGVAHMDLKLDNLLIASDFSLKIADFDMAHFKEDAIIISNGSKFYRAPEVMNGRCNNPKAADIYSAGVVLFILKAKGIFPQFEGNNIDKINFAQLLNNNDPKFWTHHCRIQKKPDSFFDQDFKDLFKSMCKFDPNDRASIKAIKASKWYNGPHYSPKELRHLMSRLNC